MESKLILTFANPLWHLKRAVVRARDEVVMEKCPGTQQLLQWLNGQMDEPDSSQLAIHVADCDDCKAQLDRLTDSETLKPPGGKHKLDEATFTDEPHFKSLQKALPQRIGKLRSVQPRSGDERGDLQNSLQQYDEEESQAAIGTVDANVGATLPMSQLEISSRTQDAIDESLQQSFADEGYFIEGLIGRGGFAHVFQAWEKSLERSVAIKVLDRSRFDHRNKHRFLREAKTASSIDSPNVVRVLTSGETSNGRPFIVMELVQGQSLSQWVQDQFDSNEMDTDSIRQGASLLIQGCHGAQAVHNAALVHRDIKPGNIFVDPESLTAKLGDFGLARILNNDTVTLTRAEELAGTPAYMSPEQTVANGNVDSLSDVYSLGASLYQVLTGQPPFRGSSLSILKQVNEVQPVAPSLLNENVSKSFDTICLKALDKEPKRRYASAQDLALDLQKAIDGEPIDARPITRFQKLTRWARTNRALATTLGLLFVSMLAGTIVSSAMWYRAALAEKQAVDDRDAALGTLHQLVASVFDDLGQNAATIKARESVVNAAIDGLDLIAEAGGDAQADRTRMLAYRRLGGMMNYKGDQQAGEEYFVQAVDLARNLHEKSPTILTRFELASSLNYLVGHYELFQVDVDSKEDLAIESKILIEEILVDQPDNVGALYQSLEIDSNRFEQLHLATGSWPAIVEESPPVLKKLNRLLDLPQENGDAQEMAQKLKFQIGRAHFQCGNFEEADLYFDQCRSHLDEALTWSPNSLKLVEHRAVLDRVAGVFATEFGDHQRAIELVNQSIESFETLVADDPENVSRQQGLANSWLVRSKSLKYMGKHVESLEAYSKCHEIYAKLLAKTPTDNVLRSLMASGLYYERALSELALHRWEDAKETYGLVIHYLRSPEFDTEVTGLDVENQLNISMLTIAALGLADGEEGAVRNPATESVAILYAAKRDADTSTSDQLSEETLAVLSNVNPELKVKNWDELFDYLSSVEGLPEMLVMYRDQFEARCWAMKARNLAEQPESESTEDSERYTDRSLKILSRIASDFPRMRTALIYNEPDFNWLRETTQYKESGVGVR